MILIIRLILSLTHQTTLCFIVVSAADGNAELLLSKNFTDIDKSVELFKLLYNMQSCCSTINREPGGLNHETSNEETIPWSCYALYKILSLGKAS